jgi:hypothetical protein
MSAELAEAVLFTSPLPLETQRFVLSCFWRVPTRMQLITKDKRR